MRHRPRGSAIVCLTLCAALVSLFAGCGQQGPLALPESARSIERLPPVAAPEEGQDDEPENER